MSTVPRNSLVEQTAEHLRNGFRSGRWKGYLPGVKRLADELCISRDTLRAAVVKLEKDGSLCSQGSGRRRKIISGNNGKASKRKLRVAILLSEPFALYTSHAHEMILTIKHRVEQAGHACMIMDRSISQLGNQLPRVIRMVNSTEADAWIVYAGPRDVLEWFAERKQPVMAIGGTHGSLPVAISSSDAADAMTEAMGHLIRLGHRRIVFIASERFHRPGKGSIVTAFYKSLEAAGIKSSEYNFPEWDWTQAGFEGLLTSLFSITPPTALILFKATYCVATLAFLARRNIQVPRDLSLISMTMEPAFSWHNPPFAHFDWPMSIHIRRAVTWVQNVASGKTAPTVHIANATFHPGGTTAAAPSLR